MLILGHSRHLESHNLYTCSRCLTTFDSKEQKAIHNHARLCVKSCTHSACRRYTLTYIATCKCILSSDDQWAAIFCEVFPHQPLAEPWSSTVQPWLRRPKTNVPYDESQLPNLEELHQLQDFELLSESPTQPETSSPFGPYHDTVQDTASTQAFGFSLGQPNTLDSGNLQYTVNTIAANAGPVANSNFMQPSSHADIQKLREQLAIVEQRVERPRGTEQKHKAMARLLWEHLVQNGDPSVQEGGRLRQFAEMLTPDIIEDGMTGGDAVEVPQPSNGFDTMDWSAAGLAPQQMAFGGKGKQPVAPGGTDSAYYSATRFG